jgi:hypothetical protein
LQRVAVPYTIEGSQLSTRQLRWPDFCACCGLPHPGSDRPLRHEARRSSSTTDYGTVRTTTTSGYPLSWALPMCDACVAHQKRAVNPVQPGVLMLGFVVLTAIVGFTLFSLGIDGSDGVSVVAFVAFLGAVLVGGFLFYRRSGEQHLAEARTMMSPKCTDCGVSAAVTSDLANIFFAFPNDLYGQSFASLNGLG